MSTATNQHQFLWFDLETTGLDAKAGLILEWALVFAEDGPGGVLTPVHQYTELVCYPDMGAVLALMDRRVVEMHTKNGILGELEAGAGETLADTDDMLCTILDEHAGPGTKDLILAGANVGAFDLPWARQHLPKFAARLHYRTFDSNTIALEAKARFGVDLKRDSAHRALADVHQSLAVVRAARALMVKS
jgi:oligoribonuclease (3'-5' exoribonuclease)